MLRYFTICAILSVVLMSALLSVQAPKSSGCASGRVTANVCYVPEATLTDRVPAEKPCLSCTLTAAAGLPVEPGGVRVAGFQFVETRPRERVVSPDDRPPRA